MTLILLPRVQAGEDNVADAIVRFWSGDRLAVAEVRRHAKSAGLGRPALAAVPTRELARQRFRLLARLLVANNTTAQGDERSRHSPSQYRWGTVEV